MSIAQLCLGTASWGQPYRGRVPPTDAELISMLDLAAKRGVRWLDTAVAYGVAETRLIELGAQEQFKIVTKVRSWEVVDSQLEPYAAAWLYHAQPDEWLPDSFVHAGRRRLGQAWGVSAYTPAQAMAALDLHVQVIQVPWSGWSVENWMPVRDRAYSDGVLFFGRQPFGPHGEAFDVDAEHRRDAFTYALTTNPRGWCVVGVETVDQLAELCDWRDTCS